MGLLWTKSFFFFFQAEDGIRDYKVTGVQTCALPISSGPFIKINSTAIPDNLFESELFGYEKGAFTGANNSKPGKFELADKGTLFLDEIGDVPAPIQVKLLRVLQEREFERLGGTKTIKVDVRLVAAANKDLRAALEQGTF